MKIIKIFFCCLALSAQILIISGCSNHKSNNYTNYFTNYEVQDELTKSFYDHIEIKITTPPSHSENETDVEVTIPDLVAVYQNNREEFIIAENTDDVKNLLQDHLNDHVLTYTVAETVCLDDGVWKLNSTEQIDILIAKVVDEYLDVAMSDIKSDDCTIEINANVFDKMLETTRGALERETFN